MIFSHSDEDSIIARCTPAGSGAIALLRLSGKNAVEIASSMALLPGKKSLLAQQTHTIHYGYVTDAQGNHIDQVLFLLMRGPNNFTGQDTVEITGHNNPFLVEQIIQRALQLGARMAHEGEFTKRAMLNGKIDLLQAEAINDLINANTQLSLKQSLSQLEGSFSQQMHVVEKELLKGLAFCEASFEFIDEEMEFGDRIQAIINNVLSTIKTLKKNYDQQQQIRQGVRIALLGSVNAGKSSLFNALLNKQRSIVTEIAGTTRDTIEAGLYCNGNYWTLVDTAGLRVTNDVVEQEGIRRSFEEATTADIIILVIDSARAITADELAVYQQIIAAHRHKIIFVGTKTDLPRITNPLLDATDCPLLLVSSTHKTNIAILEQEIQNKISALFNSLDSPFLLNKRQYNLLIALENKLHSLQPLFDSQIPYELLSVHLNDALAHMAELTGKSISEAAMDAVFREFCVGK